MPATAAAAFSLLLVATVVVVCLTETQLSLVSGSCNGRGRRRWCLGLGGRRRRLSHRRSRRVDIAPGQSVVKQSELCAHHINEYQLRSAIVASRRGGTFYGEMVMTVMKIEGAVNP